MRSSRRVKYAAYHEAGHAVLADYHDVLQSVSLEPEPITLFEAYDLSVTGQVVYAGILAQARYQRRSLAYAAITGGDGDLAIIDDYATVEAGIRLMPPKAIRRQWEEEARKVLKERWQGVRAVAEALVEQGSLTKERVRRLLRKRAKKAQRGRAEGP